MNNTLIFHQLLAFIEEKNTNIITNKARKRKAIKFYPTALKDHIPFFLFKTQT